ncbi:flavodoxin family protein [candidate division KSB1 bacterium]|nr:flavodoxin family protein [candidate division KSB1 bacterium]
MKKIFGIVGSPRKGGNTHVLVSRLLEGCRHGGGATEIVLLGEKDIKECDGCHVCWKDKDCPKWDDMNNLYQPFTDCDVVVFGTPVYWYGPTALMKCFVDRLVYYNCPQNREKMRKKQAVLVIPFEENDLKTADLTIRFFEKSLDYLNIEIAGRILAPNVTKKGEVKRDHQIMRRVYELGEWLVKK